MKKLIATVLTIISFNTIASVMIIDNSDFRCSDGTTYDVLRHFIGGWGEGEWQMAGICNQGILSSNEYNGRIMSLKDSHPEVAKCLEQDTPALRLCYEEFIQNNGTKGAGLPLIKHFDGVVGQTCGDRISKIKERIDSQRAHPQYYSESQLRKSIKMYEIAVRECSEESVENGNEASQR